MTIVLLIIWCRKAFSAPGCAAEAFAAKGGLWVTGCCCAAARLASVELLMGAVEIGRFCSNLSVSNNNLVNQSIRSLRL